MTRRVRLTPYIDQSAKVWLTRYAKRNLWRVRRWYELEDLIQEGFLIFCRVLERYRATVTDQPHMMRLFQTAFTHHLTDLARQRLRDPTEILDADLSPEQNFFVHHCISNTDYDETITKVHAPAPMRLVISALEQANGAALRVDCQHGPNGRETTNERLCRLADLNPQKIDVATEIRDYLLSS